MRVLNEERKKKVRREWKERDSIDYVVYIYMNLLFRMRRSNGEERKLLRK